jgi:hypothetical protein
MCRSHHTHVRKSVHQLQRDIVRLRQLLRHFDSVPPTAYWHNILLKNYDAQDS